jgi:protein kinase A
MLIYSLRAVIKLKQVEHVQNERNVLAAVAGYPFITTLVTSFSDETCLYMLVRWINLP